VIQTTIELIQPIVARTAKSAKINFFPRSETASFQRKGQTAAAETIWDEALQENLVAS
jgi:hypothetical protein